METTTNTHGTITAHKSPKGIIIEDGDHKNCYTGSRYGWRILLVRRQELPDQYELDVARQQTSRFAIPYYDDKDVRLIKRGYICQ
jgi:hypothetical protein